MKALLKKRSFWTLAAAGITAGVIAFLVIGFDNPTPTANATPTTSASPTTTTLPEDCKQLQGTFAVPAQHCTSEDVNPRPLDEISPNGDAGSCWPARQFDSPTKASGWLATNAAGKLRAQQFSDFAANHRDYNGYAGTTGDDYAEYVGTLIREPLPYPIRILNHYCDANGVKQWKVQVMPVGKMVYFRRGYSPSQTTPEKIRPVKLEACGNDVLPPPPPPPPVCPPGSDMAGKLPGKTGCDTPTSTITRPPSTTIPPTTRTTIVCPPGNDTSSCGPKRKEDGPVHSGDIPSQAQGTNPPATGPATPPTAGQPKPTRTNPPAPAPTTTSRPASTQTTQPPPTATATRTYAPTCAPNDPNPACD